MPLIALLMAATLGTSAYVLWLRYGAQILAGPDYQLTPDRIEIPPLPSWIRADVRREAILRGSLEQLDIRQPDLTVRVAQAFALHPWVQKVTRVSKNYPAALHVELTYRRPAAMVEVAHGLLPVDEEGVLLPTDDFTPEGARRYPRIVAGDSSPVGPPGTPWGSSHVAGAARIAGLLGPQWDRLQLYRVVVAPRDPDSSGQNAPLYELWTRRGTRILWGRAPGEESPGEATAAEKIHRLVQYVAQHGPLDKLSDRPPQTIDVREARQMTVEPRTARRDAPGDP